MTSVKQIIFGIVLLSFTQIYPTRADACLSPGCSSIWLFYMKHWSWAPAVSCREQTVGYWRYIRCRPTLSKVSGHLWLIEDPDKNDIKVRPINGKAIGLAMQGISLPQPDYPILVSVGKYLIVESIPGILEHFDK